MRRQRATGVTLLEVLIASALFSIIGGAISLSFIGGDRVARQTSSIQQAQSQARQAMVQLESEIRAGYGSSLDSVDILSDILTFSTLQPNSTTPVSLSYFQDASNNLVRQQGLGSRIVADNVTSFELTAATANSVTVVLTIEVDGQRAVLGTTIGFRNP